MVLKVEQVIFVGIRMEDGTNYIFNNIEAAQAIYTQLIEFESYCEEIGIKPYFYRPSKSRDETYIREIMLDSGDAVNLNFMKIEYFRLSYEPEKE